MIPVDNLPLEAFNSPKNLIDWNEIVHVDVTTPEKKQFEVKEIDFITSGEESEKCADLSGMNANLCFNFFY